MHTTKKLMTLLLALLGFSQVIAQEYEYVPFVREGVKWVYYYDNPIQGFSYEDGFIPYGEHYYTLEIKGDSVINGKTYKAMHLYSGHAIDELNDTIPVYLREENRIVYGIIPDNRRYWECPIGIGTDVDGMVLSSTVQTGVEFVLYDFYDPETFYSRYDCGYPYTLADTVQIGHQLRKRLHFTYEGEYIIEGLGYVGIIGMPLNYFYPVSTGVTQVVNHLSHVIEDGEIVYKTKWYKDPEPQESDYLPLVREGVIWVNEKVIVNHGDTIRYYYKYEISGKDSLDIDLHGYAFNACYYYTGHELNTEMDSLIAGLSYDSQDWMHRVFCYRNDPYYINKWEGKFLFILGGLMTPYIPMLYNFKYCPEYYMFAANEIDDEPPILTEDNFKEIDPVVIEGIACRRYAYISENGTPLAYVVEGIGFDSYDMGDLLTPFTKRPDPDADYQEWCGLSHVIKDGKIIYKGMRYRPYIPGDVNGDGEITVADAGSVIDVVIMGGNAGHTRIPAADVNGDGEVNVADVNAIIDMILSNH